MGNDLLIATLAIEVGKQPDWKAARKRVREMNDVELDEAFVQWQGESPWDTESDEIDRVACRAELLRLIREVKEATQSEHRHLFATEYIVPGWMVWLTGGDSWGDSPSEEFDLYNAFRNAGWPGVTLAEAAGFATKFVDRDDSQS